jgi:hypothetical protein
VLSGNLSRSNISDHVLNLNAVMDMSLITTDVDSRIANNGRFKTGHSGSFTFTSGATTYTPPMRWASILLHPM